MNVSGSYCIAATHCTPDSGPGKALQILTHGIGFDRSYWDFPAVHGRNYSYVNAALERAFGLERAFTTTVASLAPPRESGERLLPGLCYVLVASMAGSIVARNRRLWVVRAAAPLALGLAAASFLRYGVDLLVMVIAGLIVACALFKGTRPTIGIIRDALAQGARNALPVGMACAIVGIVIGTLTLTGIASTFIGAIIAIGQNNLFLSLLLTMLTCLVLGTSSFP